MADPTFTPTGSVRFEQARAALARRRDVELEAVSDADVVASLAPGPAPAPPQRRGTP